MPQMEALFDHYLDISGDAVNSSAYTYMGTLLTLRPPAAGGQPEKARQHFEKAIEIWPEYVTPFVNLAGLALDKGERSEAMGGIWGAQPPRNHTEAK